MGFNSAFKGLRPLLALHPPLSALTHHRDNVTALHGRPNLTSEVGYTPAMPRREDYEVHKRTRGGIGGEKNFTDNTDHF